MNHLSAWDRETLTIAKELDTIEQEVFNADNRERRAMVQLNACIFQLQTVLSTVLDRLVNLTNRGSLLQPMERSLVHWAAVYSEKVHHFYVRQVQQMGKHMWLKLIRARLSSQNHNADVDVSDQHLVEMSVRRSDLLQTERYLKQHQLKLEIKKGELRQQYDDLRTTVANLEAAGSMCATLGKGKDAFKNPAIQSVSKYMNMLFNGSQASSRKDYSYMKDLSQHISRQTDLVMSHCRNLVLDEVRYPKPELATQKKTEYERSLAHVQSLQTQLSHAVNLLVQEPPPTRPNLMKNPSNQATN